MENKTSKFYAVFWFDQVSFDKFLMCVQFFQPIGLSVFNQLRLDGLHISGKIKHLMAWIISVEV